MHSTRLALAAQLRLQAQKLRELSEQQNSHLAIINQLKQALEITKGGAKSSETPDERTNEASSGISQVGAQASISEPKKTKTLAPVPAKASERGSIERGGSSPKSSLAERLAQSTGRHRQWGSSSNTREGSATSPRSPPRQEPATTPPRTTPSAKGRASTPGTNERRTPYREVDL